MAHPLFKTALLSLGLAFAATSMAQEEVPWRFKIKGHTRTLGIYIRELATRCVNDAPMPEDDPAWPKNIRQCILNSKLFSEVGVTRLGPRRVSIVVKDRWTFIPIPIFQTDSGGGRAFGLMLLETNFWGRGIFLLGGTQRTDRGHSTLLVVNDKTVQGSNVSAVLVGYEAAEELTAGIDTPLYRMKESQVLVMPGIGYELWPKTKVTFNLLWRGHEFEALGGDTPPDDYAEVAARLLTEVDHSNYKFYYNDGWSLRNETALQTWRSDTLPLAGNFYLAGHWQFSPWLRHAIHYQGILSLIRGGGVADPYRLGGERGYRGIPRGRLWASSSFSNALDYHIPLTRPPYGTWTLAAFGDLSWYEQVVRQDRFERFEAEGLGIYLFLKQVAIPGVGLLWGVRDRRTPFVSLSLGASF